MGGRERRVDIVASADGVRTKIAIETCLAELLF